MFTVTEDWIRKNASAGGGWTRDQLDVLGVSWPPESGWIRRTIGLRLTEDQRARFEQRVRAGRARFEARSIGLL